MTTYLRSIVTRGTCPHAATITKTETIELYWDGRFESFDRIRLLCTDCGKRRPRPKEDAQTSNDEELDRQRRMEAEGITEQDIAETRPDFGMY